MCLFKDCFAMRSRDLYIKTLFKTLAWVNGALTLSQINKKKGNHQAELPYLYLSFNNTRKQTNYDVLIV